MHARGEMSRKLVTRGLAASLVLIGSGWLANSAVAGWGYSYAAPSYYVSPPIYYAPVNYGYVPHTTWYGSSYHYAPVQSYYPAHSYYGGPVWGGRRGKVKYDVYTPYGKREVEYKFKRDGRVEIDYD